MKLLIGFLGDHANMKSQQGLLLESKETSPSTIHISGKCNYHEERYIRFIFANGIPLFHNTRDDKAANQYAMIHLVEAGLAIQREGAEAFNCSRLTIFRAKKKYNEGGHGRFSFQKHRS